MSSEIEARLRELTRRHRRLHLVTVVVAVVAFLIGMLVCGTAH